MAERGRGAVFLDRDGTLAEDPGYLHEPDAVRLLPGVADGLRRLSAAGWPLVLVSNQSGIALGFYGAEAFHAVNRRIETLAGVRFAGTYFCPHLPEVSGPCECRKPGTALFRAAAADLGLDLSRSWYVGDRLRDAQPALSLGGRGIVVGPAAPADGSHAPPAAAPEGPGMSAVRTAADFGEAASAILSQVP